MSGNSIEIRLPIAEVERAMQEYLDRVYTPSRTPKVASVRFDRSGPVDKLVIKAITPDTSEG